MGSPGALDWEDKHKTFHRALVSGCGSRWIMRISEQLFDAAERYRILAADYVPERNELDEHRAIVDACLERDDSRAVHLLGLHYGQTFDVIVASIDRMEGPTPGAPSLSTAGDRV